jgi:hypothetical protein
MAAILPRITTESLIGNQILADYLDPQNPNTPYERLGNVKHWNSRLVYRAYFNSVFQTATKRTSLQVPEHEDVETTDIRFGIFFYRFA